MKTKLIIGAFALLALTLLLGCDLIDKADDVSFDTELPVYFSINETEVNAEGKTYNGEVELDITSDADVSKYASKIKEIKVNRISYYIDGVNPGGVTFNSGLLRMVSANQVIATLGNTALNEGANGDFITDAAGFNELSSRLKNNKREIIRMSGNLSTTPITFRLRCTFYVTVKADALK
ncbi:MAG: hypothetical protein MUE95_06075 [Cyclobacteriaceae bacterium]|jgi:hypothetical protein|nr:hypothetical protein [Cyclobacteriaceae bacterium]